MSNDIYLSNIIQKYQVNRPVVESRLVHICQKLQSWAGNALVSIEFSGSLAKGTAVNISSDADIFVSLSSTLNMSLADIYESLYHAFNDRQYNVRKQNVSIGIEFNGYKVDLVAGRRISQYGNDHSLYFKENNTWTKTNIRNHVSLINSSTRKNEIKLLKIWKSLHGIKFPSIFLELIVIESLHGRHSLSLERNVEHVLMYLCNNINHVKIIDPSNSSNIISDSLSNAEKNIIRSHATHAVNENQWNKVVW